MTPLSIIEAAKMRLENLTFELRDAMFHRDRAQKEVEQATERLLDYDNRIEQIKREKVEIEEWLNAENEVQDGDS